MNEIKTNVNDESKAWNTEFFNDLVSKRTSYSDMIQFCCDDYILNNSIQNIPENAGYYFEPYCGNYYDEETDEYIEIYQQYIIDERAAERFADYTNEIVLYNDECDIYLLCVTHWGTMWSGVSANWKTLDEYIKNL